MASVQTVGIDILAPFVHSSFCEIISIGTGRHSFCLFLCSRLRHHFSCQSWILRMTGFIGLFLSHIDTVHTNTGADYRSSFHKWSTCTHVLYMCSICSPVLSAVLWPCCLSLTATGGHTHPAIRGNGRTTARQNKEKEKGHVHIQLIYCWQDINNFLSEGLWFCRFPLFITECNNNV